MLRDFSVGRPADDKELDALAAIATLAFGGPFEQVRTWLNQLGPEMMRVARVGRVVAGGLVVCPMGQWFGGRCVPMTGIAMVCVAPEHRASGVGSQLMRATVEELYADHVPLSALYAATKPVYQRVGYEAAGGRYEIKLSPHAITLRERALELRETAFADNAAWGEAYRKRARMGCGDIDETAPAWRRALPPAKVQPVCEYAVWNGKRVEGWIKYLAKREERTLNIRMLGALTPQAGRRLLTFLADHRSQVEWALWHGSPTDPILLLLDEQPYRIRLCDHWLMRVCDVPRALSRRGYPAGVKAALHLEVCDDVLPRNHGRFVLEVSGSRGKVTRGGRGEIKIDVRGLSALYTGHLSPFELAMTPYLEATAERLAALQPVFAGPLPAMAAAF